MFTLNLVLDSRNQRRKTGHAFVGKAGALSSKDAPVEQRQLFRYCVRDFKGIETGSCHRGDILKGPSRCTSVRLGLQSRRSARINAFKVSLASGLEFLLSFGTPLLNLSANIVILDLW